MIAIQVISLILLASTIIFLVLYLKTKKKNDATELDLKTALKAEERIKQAMEKEIKDAANRARSITNSANEKSEKIIQDANTKSANILQGANDKSVEIIESSKIEADKMMEKALELKAKSALYEETVKSMKDIINGYGDEYLIPSISLLDDLAAEYDYEMAGKELAEARKKIKSYIKEGKAAKCDYKEFNRQKTAIEFVLDAFNGKVDSILSKVKSTNFGTLEKKIKDSFNVVNYNGTAFRNARITKEYLELNLKQLELAVKVQELKKRDQEEQRKIKEQIREEERARKEYEKAIKDAEKEERLLQSAMKKAEAMLKEAADEDKEKFENEIRELKEKLILAEEKESRAKSMAEQTRKGHVYVISNVGSFGEHIYKIGLTRRLEPMDRVKELGDASVPFKFDVHAMIYSDDAPLLEKELHENFKIHQVNKVNPRKEFFNVNIDEIKSLVEDKGHAVHWTMKAEAAEFRESLAIKQ